MRNWVTIKFWKAQKIRKGMNLRHSITDVKCAAVRLTTLDDQNHGSSFLSNKHNFRQSRNQCPSNHNRTCHSIFSLERAGELHVICSLF
jgi:hypothetical protein